MVWLQRTTNYLPKTTINEDVFLGDIFKCVTDDAVKIFKLFIFYNSTNHRSMVNTASLKTTVTLRSTLKPFCHKSSTWARMPKCRLSHGMVL